MSLDLVLRAYPKGKTFRRLDGILALWLIYLVEAGYAASTIDGHLQRIRRVRQVSAKHGLEFMAASPQTVRVLIARAATTPGQTRQLDATLRVFYGFLGAKGWRPDDPMWSVARPDPRHGALRVLDGSA